MVTRQAILEYRTTGDGQATSNVVRLADALERQRQNAERLSPALKRAANDTGAMGAVSQSATAKITSLTNQIGPLGAGLGHISRQAPLAAMGMLRWASAAERASLANRLLNGAIVAGTSATLAGGVAIAAMTDNAIRAGDTYATLHARIRTYSLGAIQTAQIERDLYANAKDARAAIDGQVTLYARLSPAVRDYGKSQEDALRVTKLVSKAQAIQGADIREQLASTIQFSQSIASGVLRGDELRSMLESSPQLLRYVAQNLDLGTGKIGVAFSALRNLGKEGQLTTERILDALVRAEPQIEKDFVNAPKKAQQGWQILTDQITRGVGQLAAASGAQQGLVEWLLKMADATDALRQKLLMDPGALEPIKATTRFIGEAVASIGDFGGVAIDHFDDIVLAGQAIIALKLGSVFASWFAAAASGSRDALRNLQTYRAAALASAGATLNPAAAGAAVSLRDGALAVQIRATELQAQAEVKLAQATAARAAATRAATAAGAEAAAVMIGATASSGAAARAQLLSAAATRAEADAKKAQLAATSAATAASVRNTIAQEAETLATAGVTRGMLAKGAALRLVNGLYAALGGAVGVAGIAIGALIYAIYRSEEAYKAQVAAQRDALVVSDDLQRITQAMTSATWAQVPALLAQAQAIREGAVAARQEAEAQLALARARRDAYMAQINRGGDPEGVLGAVSAAGAADRRVRDTEGNLAAARRDEFGANMQSRLQTLTALTLEASTIRRQLDSGKDLAGRPLSAGAKAQLEARRSTLFATGQRQVDAYDTAVRQQQAAMEAASGGKKASLRQGLKLYSDAFQTATELVATADNPSAAARPTAGGGKRITVPGGVSQALTELIQQQYMPLGGKNRFSLSGGIIRDGQGGGVFTARSEDEAAAAAKYVKQLEAINGATDAQIAKTGKSRQALREAASAMLDNAVATSKASVADDKWADIQAEMEGQSRAVVKAQREVNDLTQAGADITDDAAAAYLAYVAAREKARRMQQGMQIAEPSARKAFELVTSGLVLPTDGRGVVDMAAATRQMEAQRGAILVESERRIRAELATLRQAEGLTEQQYQQRLSDALAANRIAVETTLQERLLDLEKDRLSRSAEYAESRYAQTADAIIQALDDVRHGHFADAGRNLANDLLDGIYQELLYSPLRKAIIDTLRATVSGGGGGGLLGKLATSFFGAVAGNRFGGSNTYSSVAWDNLDLTGAFAGGGWVKGRGTGTSDSNLAWVSDREFIVREQAARRHGPLLEAINGGYQPPAFARGGWVGGGYAGFSAGKVEVHNHLGVEAQAEVTPTRDGGLKVDLMPVMKDGARSYVRSPDFGRDVRRTQFGPKKRG